MTWEEFKAKTKETADKAEKKLRQASAATMKFIGEHPVLCVAGAVGLHMIGGQLAKTAEKKTMVCSIQEAGYDTGEEDEATVRFTSDLQKTLERHKYTPGDSAYIVCGKDGAVDLFVNRF